MSVSRGDVVLVDYANSMPSPWHDCLLLKAARREPVERTPIWLMRQAGRYMAEYRAIRAKHTLLEICAQPELAAEVTLQPVRAFGVDAAILFADILLPLMPMGIRLEFAKGEGPVIHNPIASRADAEALRVIDPCEELRHVLDAVKLARRELDGQTPLIGFAGAPFTLASYLIEGGSSRNFVKTKQLMYRDPQTWHLLMGKLAQVIAAYLAAQVDAGAQAVQLFDSWGGALSPDDYRQYVLPHSHQVLEAVRRTGAPCIHFGTDTAALLPLMKEAGGDVIGLDWRVELERGWETVGFDRAVQGNLDPVALFAPHHELERRVRRILGITRDVTERKQLEAAFAGLTDQVTLKTQEVQYLQRSTDQILDAVPTPILIVDDQAIVRKGIRALLDEVKGMDVIGEAADGLEAVQQAASLQPDVILMDLVMPKLDGIEAIRRILVDEPKARILVLTSFAADDKVFPAIKAGALGYLLKDSEPEELIAAIKNIYRGQPFLAIERPGEGHRPVHRLGVAPRARPGGGVADVADGEVAVERGETALVEHLVDEAHVLDDGDRLAVAGRDPGRLLAAMLQRVEPEVHQVGDRLAGGVHPEDAACLPDVRVHHHEYRMRAAPARVSGRASAWRRSQRSRPVRSRP